MTDKILYRVLCDEYEEVARIFFEIKETGEQIEGSHQIQKWINNVFNENEQLKQRNINQYNQLNKLWQLIEAKDWETLTEWIIKMKEDEEQLQQEWKCYE